ncbi:MAG: hypothetical protein D6701_06075 [Gemmatimonadetes bacterium]|nr:MAG: hypothetical protein D6701_06075 [Gemmatimonadota bacterium]
MTDLFGARRSALVLALAVASAMPGRARAQFDEPPPPPAYALTNVTVVHADGRREEGVTLVVRGGMVETLRAGADVPADALQLEGDSLWVYPGLVDAQGSAEVAFPEVERPDGAVPWNAPRAVQGLLAHRRVADHLAATGEDGADQRKKGVVAAGIHAEGSLAAGRAAAIVWRPDAATPWELIGDEVVGLDMSFRGARGAYPGTLFAVIAYIRQAFEDANREGRIQAAYARDPKGLAPPRWDPDYAVLREVVAGAYPVFFAADEAEDIRRVLGLADEFGFRPVIVGGEEAWKVAGDLARRNVPVLVNGDFPKPSDWDPKAEDQENLEPAAAREKKRVEAAWSNPARLAEAGVRFAITSGGGKADLRDAARKAIEYGLSEEAALRAITTTPAELLGLPNVPRVGKDLTATFVVMDGPIFDEGTNVNYTFVEGGLERGKKPGAKNGGGGAAAAVNVSGAWILSVEAGGAQFDFEATFTQAPDGSFTGSASNPDAGDATVSGSVSGNSISLTLSLDAGGQSVELTASGTVEGDTMSGSGESPFGEFSFTGRRKPGGAR